MEIPVSSEKSKLYRNNKLLIGIAFFVASGVLLKVTSNESIDNGFKASDFLIAEVQQGESTLIS